MIKNHLFVCNFDVPLAIQDYSPALGIAKIDRVTAYRFLTPKYLTVRFHSNTALIPLVVPSDRFLFATENTLIMDDKIILKMDLRKFSR